MEQLLGQGLSLAEIGRRFGRHEATVSYWLRKYGLEAVNRAKDEAKGGLTREQLQPQLQLRCSRHGMTTFKRRTGGGYRCAKCRAEAVVRRRRNVKRILVEEAGGSCAVCGYRKCFAALEFHHLVPAEKSFALSHRGVARSLEKARAEASKCVLLCANCHSEVEAGLVSLA